MEALRVAIQRPLSKHVGENYGNKINEKQLVMTREPMETELGNGEEGEPFGDHPDRVRAYVERLAHSP